MNDFWIILTGCLVAIPCAILGCFLVLRKMVMVGDAISHAVLPGIVLAYMVTKEFDSMYMLIGAALIGMFTTFLIEFFHRAGGLQQDAAIGVTFTWMFAIGVILVSVFTSGTDLDQDCVLYGEILNIPFNRWITESGMDLGPISVWFLGILNIIVIMGVFIAYKELFITTFDPAFSLAIGISGVIWHYILMGSVSFVTVASFESVGAILVIAFLVAPAASAYLLTYQLKKMMFYAVGFGVLSVGIGYYFSYLFNCSTSGAIVTVNGIIFGVVLLTSKQGLFKRNQAEVISTP